MATLKQSKRRWKVAPRGCFQSQLISRGFEAKSKCESKRQYECPHSAFTIVLPCGRKYDLIAAASRFQLLPGGLCPSSLRTSSHCPAWLGDHPNKITSGFFMGPWAEPRGRSNSLSAACRDRRHGYASSSGPVQFRFSVLRRRRRAPARVAGRFPRSRLPRQPTEARTPAGRRPPAGSGRGALRLHQSCLRP
jgi:hypothetical protein